MIDRALGQYHILEELGRGGMAVVCKAYHPTLERYVAIKMLPRELTFDREFVERFMREARAAARLNHPHIVTIHDVGQAAGTRFIVMEFVDGPSLDDLLRRQGALPPDHVCQIIAQVASALDYAHQHGFVHRDIKPGNILLGAGGVAKLTDFGIVRAADETRLTQTGTLLGTPEYMSPEQARGSRIGRGTDIYSLGVVTYEMLSGCVPFGGGTMAVLHAHAYDPPDLSVLPRQVQGVVGKALAKDPGQRYASPGELAQALIGTLSGTAAEVGENDTPSRLVGQPRSRRQSTSGWVWAALGAVAAALVLSVTLALSGHAGRGTNTIGAPDRVSRSGASDGSSAQHTVLQDTATPDPVPVGHGAASPTLPSTLTPLRVVLPTDTPTVTPLPKSTSMPSPTPCGVAIHSGFASVWSEVKSRLGCPARPANPAQWMAEESFERGRMFWREDTDHVYVLYDNGTWELLRNSWSEGMPTYSCGVSESPPTPLRGFGKAWCDHLWVREGLGSATTAEHGEHGAVQDFVGGGAIIRSSSGTYVLFGDGSWERR